MTPRLERVHRLWFLPSDPMREKWRYLLVGGLAWIVDFSLFVLLFPVAGLVLAQTAARSVGALLTFLGNKHYVFLDHRYSRLLVARQTVAYIVLWFCSYAVSLLGIFWLVVGTGFHEVGAKLLVEAVILASNYLVTKYLIFR